MRERYKAFLRRSFEEQEHQDEEDLRAAPVPLYGLPPAFQGPRTAERHRIAAGGWAASHCPSGRMSADPSGRSSCRSTTHRGP